MTTITVRGDLYEINFFEIGLKEFLILTGRITEDEEVDWDDEDLRTHQLTLPRRYEDEVRNTEFWGELVEDNLMGSPLISGFTYDESGPNLDIEVDGEDLTATEVLNLPVPNFEKAALSRVVTSKLKPEDDTYTLFIESWDRGSFTLEMEAEYDPSKLSLYIENQILPDGSIESVVNPSYEGGDFEFDGSDNRGHDIYIVTPDGERHEL
jgi:hypothetical protein